MNNPPAPADTPVDANREAIMSALFANMVAQQTNLALMLLGKMPHPETGETMQDLESARLFIDTLEMLEFKTQGRLTKPEEQMLKRSLTSLRLAFVEAVEHPVSVPGESKAPPAGDTPPAQQGAQPGETAKPTEATGTADSKESPGEEASRKKFTKKY